MLTGDYQFHCRFTSPAILPAFKGSMLRGSFGHALKAVTCALRRQSCDNCLLSATCVYCYIFETGRPPPDPHEKPRITVRPHPYVLTPPLEATRAYVHGDTLDFGLTLFGRANDYLPHIVYAVEQMGETGLGKAATRHQGRVTLTSITAEGSTIYDHTRQVLDLNRPLRQLAVAPPDNEPVNGLAVRLITPLRLKQHNQFQDSLPFHLLIRAALRRISTLENAHGQGEPALDYAGLVKRAAAVTIAHSQCQWLDLERYSSRQKTNMLMGGLRGSITYQGELTEFVPLLRYCEKVNLGKQTTFGLGKIEIL